MSEARRLLSRVRGRMALGAALEDLQRGIAAGAVVALAGLSLRALGVLEFDPLLAPLVGGSVAVAFPLGGLVVRRRHRARIAAEADKRLGLEERLSTALWCETDPAGRTDPLGELVRSDAEGVAGRVDGSAIRAAFRPRFLRRWAWAAAAAVLASAVVATYQPIAEAAETKEQKSARLAREDRNGQVAQKLKEQAQKVEEAAKERKLTRLAKTAQTVKKEARELMANPPDRQEMLSRINKLRDVVRADARRLAGTPPDLDERKADAANKALSKLLEDMAKAGLENLQSDLSDLAKRLEEGEQGTNPPSLNEIQAMASRIDALKRAIEKAGDGATGKELREQLNSLANQDLLDEIAKKLREIQQRMQQGQGYQQLQSEEASEWSDMGQMTREELQQLLESLEQMAAMEDLENLLSQAGRESAGGRKMRLGGSGGT